MRKDKFGVVFSSVVYVVLVVSNVLNCNAQGSDPWETVAKITNNIKLPVFAKRDFLITQFGAKPDGVTNCSNAIKQAVEACHNAGGGRVVVPAGSYFTGPVYLKSNVNLHLEKGATLLFSTNPDDYLPLVYTRWEGVELMNYSPLVYAFKETNIAITGEGTLNGQATKLNWWPWKGRSECGWVKGMPSQKDTDCRPALLAMAEVDKPVEDRKFGNGFYLRPQFIQPYCCSNVQIEGVTIINSPMWILNPVLCNNITISNVKIVSDGPNTDGCDPESCKDVWIKDCYFDTGDDCIAIKSGRNRDGRRINVPCENIVVQNCTLINGHAGIGVGSEISGGVKNLFFENCKINNTSWAVRIKTSSMRGGTTENVHIRNIEAGKTNVQAICITMMYEDSGPNFPILKDISFSDFIVKNGGEGGVFIEGYPESPAQNILFNNVSISNVKTPYKFSNTKDITFTNTLINGKKVD
jgi:polygalacturonase